MGGDYNSCAYDITCGTVFKITLSGKLTTMHSFDATGGFWPYAGLIQSTDGNFFGTTASTVFQMTPSGTLTTYTVDGTDTGVVQATGGIFYGTSGGRYYNYGTVFSFVAPGLTPPVILFNFNGTDGYGPNALTQGTDGDFYGTTDRGGTHEAGTVFRLSRTMAATNWKETVLYSFTNGSDGGYPDAGLVFDALGNLYGTTDNGGNVAGEGLCLN